jgi:hypothetical protein
VLCRGGNHSCRYFEAGELRGRATVTARLAGGWWAEPRIWALRSTDPYFPTPKFTKCLLLSPTAILLTSGCSARCCGTHKVCLESTRRNKKAYIKMQQKACCATGTETRTPWLVVLPNEVRPMPLLYSTDAQTVGEDDVMDRK